MRSMPNEDDECFSEIKYPFFRNDHVDCMEGEKYDEKIIAGQEDAGMRLDVFLSRKMGLTRSSIQHLIKKGNVESDSRQKIKPSLKVKPSQSFMITIPPAEDLEIVPEPVPFGVVHEDKELLVIDKPAGVVVHPAPGNWHGTLVHGLLYRYPEIGLFNNVIRPGIVHRLDQTTSGLMIVARNQRSLEALQKQFRNRTILKQYLALVRGYPVHKIGLIDLPIGRSRIDRKKMAVTATGKSAKTEYEVLWSYSGYSLLKCTLLTGRTHQIRVHLQHIGYPLVGDTLYGGSKIPFAEMGRVFLHSWKLHFKHPLSGQELRYTCNLPKELVLCLRDVLSKIRD